MAKNKPAPKFTPSKYISSAKKGFTKFSTGHFNRGSSRPPKFKRKMG